MVDGDPQGRGGPLHRLGHEDGDSADHVMRERVGAGRRALPAGLRTAGADREGVDATRDAG
ncbi:hypothetical protein GCM10010368_66940 [Streptomyces roseiscleroticus]|uniref:Uncharacterized protein n=1 Tax=Streptomyces roseiscleroticus TaxID=1972 RepID=A0ABP5S1E6_9ACTN